MNKIELNYKIDGYKIVTYNLNDSICAKYLDYCKETDKDSSNSSAFIGFLEDNSDLDFYEDYEIIDETLEDYSNEIFKFIAKANDNK